MVDASEELEAIQESLKKLRGQSLAIDQQIAALEKREDELLEEI
jgi:hypothetical protein